VTPAKTIRCAIYTRKSTEEGLEQAFNSLDAQREACAAYIASQRHESWVLAPELYDDGGFSGGNMNRPGLAALMADVKAGCVDVIVVYKVDRLTRSLADFAKIVEVLDAQGASFVSVTQSFNTTTSMGRLTLNVLLSFAQFEREVTGERIRDKIAASNKKGMWMGGPVPLGYDVIDRKLIPNATEAQTVQHIFETYRSLGSVTLTVDALARAGIVTKITRTAAGGTRGGIAFTRGSLAHLLGNRVCFGTGLQPSLPIVGLIGVRKPTCATATCSAGCSTMASDGQCGLVRPRRAVEPTTTMQAAPIRQRGTTKHHGGCRRTTSRRW
jgi:DNA invertase Pin-like site-specific DNA recombinase